MTWPTIPDVLYTDLVKVRTVTWGTHDAAGGRTSASGAWSAATYPCSVSASSAYEVSTHSREQMIVSHTVNCETRLGYLRDQLQWQETGAVLTIVAVQQAGDADGRTWNHYCTEVPAR